MDDRTEGWSRRALDRWLAPAVALVALAQLTLWLPHYLTWPYWADHDVFANAARSWADGHPPYRDVRLNNFPGTVYLFWALGTVVGWGRPAAFFAVDAALLLTFGLALAAWSRRLFGHAWPGMLGFLAYLSTALGLDYAHAAQRDWQAPALATLALLTLQATRGRAGLILAALLAALGFSIRPQVVLLWPALLWSAGWSDRAPDRSLMRSAGRALAWLVASTAFVAVLFLPLAAAGVFEDFLGALRLVAPGSSYNRAGGVAVAKRWIEQAADLRWWALAAALVVLLIGRGGPHRRLGWAWLLALAGTSLYQPVSPVAHSYLVLPLRVVGAAALAAALGGLAAERAGPAALRLVAALGLAAMGGTTLRPDFCEVGPTLRALRTLAGGPADPDAPPGYRANSIPSAAYYPWADLHSTLEYLRAHTAPSTRVANLLKGDPAIVSMAGRPSALPAESVTWLRMVRPEDQTAFADRLALAADSVVVWVPGEVGPNPGFATAELEVVVRQHYRPEARCGAIEVWRRRPGP